MVKDQSLTMLLFEVKTIMPKYQIWVNLDLVGHIVGDDVTREDAIQYAIDWRGEDIDPDDVDMCEIPDGYYQEIARTTAKDCAAWGM